MLATDCVGDKKEGCRARIPHRVNFQSYYSLTHFLLSRFTLCHLNDNCVIHERTTIQGDLFR